MQKTFLDVFEVKGPVQQETETERKDEVLKKEETFEEKLERLFGKNSLERETEEAEEGETEAAPERQRFKIENKEQLFWVMKKYRKIMEEKLENEAVAEKEIERIKNWLEKENEKLQQRLDFFAGLVEEYHRTLLEQDPKKKTLTTPYGSSKLRNLGPELIYDDERLIAWIEANTEEPEKYINIKKTPNKQRLKKDTEVVDDRLLVFKDTGEIVEGIAVLPRPPKFSIEIDVEEPKKERREG